MTSPISSAERFAVALSFAGKQVEHCDDAAQKKHYAHPEQQRLLDACIACMDNDVALEDAERVYRRFMLWWLNIRSPEKARAKQADYAQKGLV